MPTLNKDESIQRLQKLQSEIGQVAKKPRSSPEFVKWKRDVEVAIGFIFEPDSRHINDFSGIRYDLQFASNRTSDSDYDKRFQQGLSEANAIIESMVEEISEYWPAEESHPVEEANKNKEESRELEVPDKRKIFVVHGRNEELRQSMFRFLRALGLDPIEWRQAIAATGKTNPYIGQILDAGFRLAYSAVVILTGDDEAKLRGQFLRDDDPAYEKQLMPQARPNVLFEAGMAMGKYPERTVLVQVGQLREWTDIKGRHITHLDNTLEKRGELVTKLQTAGCNIDNNRQDWMKEGDFEQVRA